MGYIEMRNAKDNGTITINRHAILKYLLQDIKPGEIIIDAGYDDGAFWYATPRR